MFIAVDIMQTIMDSFFLGHHVIRPKIEKILSEASLHCDHDRDPGQDCCQEFQPECTDISRLTKLRPRFITCWC